MIRVAEPVTLTWHEASTVQLYAEAFDATFADVVKMCGGFAERRDDFFSDAEDSDDSDAEDSGGFDRRIVSSSESVEAWASRRAAAHETRLAALETRRDALAAAARARRSARRRTPSPRAGITPSNNSTTS